ncbi:hypothetical protein ACH5RR_038011 [Cinchona calisaya]|uniref:Uncharacterized protein n=1 Tax=Cinchona calisaya TaxID=153742 RepID=A0ABD2Y7V6_9GENT
MQKDGGPICSRVQEKLDGKKKKKKVDNRNVGGRGHDIRSFNAASSTTRSANSTGKAIDSRKMVVRGRGVVAGSAHNKGNRTDIVKVTGWDGMGRYTVAGVVGRGSAGTSPTFDADTGSSANLIGLA